LLSEKKKRAFYQSFIGQERNVLWEGVNEDGRMSGYSDNYIRLTKDFQADDVNVIEHVQIDGSNIRLEY
jgi:threonylcarbamoyladenosine tRNA methylthiotransferase MtaB